ncbi:hypothetical protein [Paraburkholderia tropica]|uniref:hypothetical protein n=1 Tax=Paraburkholderia tropica TaxID=92647 RepID=UPI002ABDCDDF|nr:hypothetical protein [Paraburkholderia tropica]
MKADASGKSVADVLRARLIDLRSQPGEMRQDRADLDRFAAAQRESFAPEIGLCTAVLVNGPQKIEAIRLKVRTYEQARAKFVERLAFPWSIRVSLDSALHLNRRDCLLKTLALSAKNPSRIGPHH